jgi:hypothetical protein
MLSGIERARDIPATQEMFDRYAAGELLQTAFLSLSAGQREFIKTGITDEDWEGLFEEGEELKDELDDSDRQTEHELYEKGWR